MHPAPLRPAAGGIHLPILGRSADQHLPCDGTCLAERLEEAADGGGATGVLEAEQRVGEATVIRQCRHHGDLAQIDLELLGDQHGHGRVRGLAHFHLGHGQDDRAIRLDAHDGTGLERGGRACGGRLSRIRKKGATCPGRHAEGQQQGAAGTETGLDQAATGWGGDAHLSLPPGRVARPPA